MGEQKININVTPVSHLDLRFKNAQTSEIRIGGNASSGTRNYNNLLNKPQINGVTLVGNQTISDLKIVSENTEAGWASNPLYLPQSGEICLFTDTARIKIGDGVVPIVDLPYIGSTDTETITTLLHQHINNTVIHVSQEDRDRWDAKLNYSADGEVLTFTRS